MPRFEAVPSVLVRVPVGVSAEAFVELHLVPREEGARRHVRSEMDEPEARPDHGRRIDSSIELVELHFAGGEQGLETSLRLDQRLAQADRLRPHRVADLARPSTLHLVQPERVGELEDVARTGMAVQLGRSRESHARPGSEILELPGGEGRDRVGSSAGVGRGHDLGFGGGGARHESHRERERVFHRTSSSESGSGVSSERVPSARGGAGTFVT